MVGCEYKLHQLVVRDEPAVAARQWGPAPDHIEYVVSSCLFLGTIAHRTSRLLDRVQDTPEMTPVVDGDRAQDGEDSRDQTNMFCAPSPKEALG